MAVPPIINNGGGSTGSGVAGAFLGGAAGAVVGNALSHPAVPAYGHAAVPPPQVAGGYAQAPVVAYQPGVFDWFWSLLGFIFKLVFLVLLAGAIGVGVRWMLKFARTMNFTAAGVFMAVQNAVSRKDLNALERLCTPSVYSAMLTTEMTESKITNLSYVRNYDDSVTYTFLCNGGAPPGNLGVRQ